MELCLLWNLRFINGVNDHIYSIRILLESNEIMGVKHTRHNAWYIGYTININC